MKTGFLCSVAAASEEIIVIGHFVFHFSPIAFTSQSIYIFLYRGQNEMNRKSFFYKLNKNEIKTKGFDWGKEK